MPHKSNVLQIVFAEFPDWEKLTASEVNSLYEQLLQLWQNSEHDKARQLFDYLFEHHFDDKKLDEFAENADADFQYFYARRLTDVIEYGDFDQARSWLKKAAKNGSWQARDHLDYMNWAVMDDICDRIKEINQQISDSFYKKDPNGVFLGEESAVCNEYGHIEFVKKELCLWDMNGALGLILAKDKPVERSKFRMTGFSPELKAVMIQLSQDASERSCYPNIIEYNTMKQSEQGGYKEDDFQTECKTWAILMQLLAHGYSLVDKEEYMSINAKMLPKIIQDEINEARGNFINHLAQDNDDWDDVEELDITHEDKKKNEKPAKKTRKNKKK